MLIYSETVLFKVGIYLFKVNNKTLENGVKNIHYKQKKATERHQLTWTHSSRRFGVFLFNCEYILVLVLLFLMLTLN